MTNDKYFTPVEAADYLRSSTSTLAKLRLLGQAPAFVRIGRAVRYRQSDLDAWMDGSTTLHSRPRTVRR
jgi:excisionase family DNA binding protein